MSARGRRADARLEVVAERAELLDVAHPRRCPARGELNEVAVVADLAGAALVVVTELLAVHDTRR
ncbi:MAG TPA: hypothetical protein VFT22_00865 [Kofleriaceae bacterium]|nr:hypothetical protein [Kofleriaceae bacterium]